MPGQADVEKMRVSLLIPIKTVVKIDRMAADSRVVMSRNEVVAVLLERGTRDIVLTDDDLDTIKDRIRRNRDARA